MFYPSRVGSSGLEIEDCLFIVLGNTPRVTEGEAVEDLGKWVVGAIRVGKASEDFCRAGEIYLSSSQPTIFSNGFDMMKTHHQPHAI